MSLAIAMPSTSSSARSAPKMRSALSALLAQSVGSSCVSVLMMRDPVGARRSEKNDHIRHLLGGAEAAHREAMADVVLEIPRVGQAVAVPPVSSTRIEPGECKLLHHKSRES